jgi:pimeloyl-ACP methyl ester carboxylesterase
VHERSVTVAGAIVNLFEVGEGTPVVLLHGLLGSPAYLLPLARSLARGGRRVLVPELPGHGRSDPVRPFSLDAAADRLAEALSQIGVERPALFGHSFGAPLAVHWALRHEVRSLVAASPVGVLPLDLRWSRKLVPFAEAVAVAAGWSADGLASSAAGRRLVFGWFVGMARPQVVAPRMGAEMIRGAARAAPVVGEALEALDGLRLAEDAAALRLPALVVWGERDAHAGNCPGLRDALCGEGRALPGCGHMPMLEAPYAFRSTVDAWL